MGELDTLKGLFERVQTAAEPSVELDEAIHAALLPDDPWWQAIVEGRRLVAEGREDAVIDRCNCRLRADTWAKGSKVSTYTAGIDAAVALVGRALPHWDLELDINGVGGLRKGWATLRGPDLSDSDMSQFAQTDGLPLPPPLAICAALLTALLAQAEAPSTSAGGKTDA